METKKEYIDALIEEYKKISNTSPDEIVKRYEARFELGKQAGMSEKEVIDMLKSPSLAAEEFIKENAKNKVTISQGEFKDLEVSLLSDSLEIISSNDTNQIKIDFNDANFNDYTIDTSNQTYALRYTPKITKKSFTFNFFPKKEDKEKTIKLYIPSSLSFERINIISTSSKIICYDLKGNDISLDSVSGKIEANNINAKNLRIKYVSGKGVFNNITANNFVINLVSGKIDVKNADVENLNFGSVSGKCTIENGKVANSTVNSLSGKLIISGKRA